MGKTQGRGEESESNRASRGQRVRQQRGEEFRTEEGRGKRRAERWRKAQNPDTDLRTRTFKKTKKTRIREKETRGKKKKALTHFAKFFARDKKRLLKKKSKKEEEKTTGRGNFTRKKAKLVGKEPSTYQGNENGFAKKTERKKQKLRGKKGPPRRKRGEEKGKSQTQKKKG